MKWGSIFIAIKQSLTIHFIGTSSQSTSFPPLSTEATSAPRPWLIPCQYDELFYLQISIVIQSQAQTAWNPCKAQSPGTLKSDYSIVQFTFPGSTFLYNYICYIASCMHSRISSKSIQRHLLIATGQQHKTQIFRRDRITLRLFPTALLNYSGNASKNIRISKKIGKRRKEK